MHSKATQKDSKLVEIDYEDSKEENLEKEVTVAHQNYEIDNDDDVDGNQILGGML